MADAALAPPAGWIVPSWSAPSNVHALMTTRRGGTSEGAWAGMNLGLHSGDDPAVVEANRRLLATGLSARPVWLRQVHGIRVVDLDAFDDGPEPVEADASFTVRSDAACAILVADCMPVLLTDHNGSRVAAAHAGWRGLLAGVLEETILRSGLVPEHTLAWIGPSIGPGRFEVGDDVRDAFVASDRSNAQAFVPRSRGKWLADLPALARRRLAACGVTEVSVSGLCTATDAARFYSYRRDGVTGRMAALIWRDH